jgi:hypothetical protein
MTMSAIPSAVTTAKVVSPARRFTTRPSDHRFFSAMAIVSSLTIIAGFFNTYGQKVMAGEPAVPFIIHVHALVFTSWLIVFVAQTTLVLGGRTDLHRRLGAASMVLAAMMLVVGVMTAITAARLGHRGVPGVEFPDAEGFLLLNLLAICVFAILVAAAWYFRRNAQVHKRLMLMSATGALIGPGASRLPFFSGNTPAIGMLVLAFLLAGPAYDLVTRRRLHPAYIWALLVSFLTSPPVVALLSATAAWRRMAALLLS